MADMLAEQGVRALTAITYRSDAEAIIRLYPTTRVVDLGREEAATLLEFERLDGPRMRRRAAWQSWHRFFRDRCKLSIPELDLRGIHRPRKTEEEEMLTPSDLIRLMTYLAKSGSSGKGNHQQYMAYLAAPLCYYGMLRISEVIRLRLCDIILVGEPHLLIRNSKGGKSRRVYLYRDKVPPTVMEFLEVAYQKRLWEVLGVLGMNKNDGSPVPEAIWKKALTATYLYPVLVEGVLSKSGLSRTFSEGLTVIGKPDCTTHTLRKSGACWRYFGGADVRQISRELGHAGVEVTFLAYLRVLDIEQRRAVEQGRGEITKAFSATWLAELLDVGPRMGQLLVKEWGLPLDVTLNLATIRQKLDEKVQSVITLLDRKASTVS